MNKISSILGCKIGKLPTPYLGLSLCLKLEANFWNEILDRFHNKLAGWKGVILSQARKVQLLKAPLQNLQVYDLSMFKIPLNYVDLIEKIQKRFLWSRVEDKKRLSLVAWEKLCKPKKLGGLGIRNIIDTNKYVLAKQCWRIFEDEKEWNSIIKIKYHLTSLKGIIQNQNDTQGSFV